MLQKLLRSKTRTKILTIFLMNPEKEMYIREVTKALNENINAVRRELSNLEQIGLLVSNTKGNMKYYTVNKDFPIYHELTSIIMKTEGISKILKNYLHNIGKIKVAFIYGSFASGEANAESDVDILIVGDLVEDELIQEIAKIEKKLFRDINYVLLSEDEFKTRVENEDPFVGHVLEEPKIMIIGDLNVK